MNIEYVDDADVEREIQERGPFSAITMAAVMLLHDVQAIDQIARDFHPEQSEVRAKLSAEHPDPSNFYEWTAQTVVSMGRSIRRLRRVLLKDRAWSKLFAVNPFTATFERYYNQCFAEIAADIGIERYSVFYSAVDPSRAKIWRRKLHLEDWGGLGLDKQEIVPFVDDAIRKLGTGLKFDLELIRTHIVKEQWRAELAADMTPSYAPHRCRTPRLIPGKRNFRVAELLKKGNSPEQVAELVKWEVKYVNRIGRQQGIISDGDA